MKRATIAVGVVVIVLALVGGYRAFQRNFDTAAVTSPAAAVDAHPSFLYGRISTVDGATYEGRLRWGGNQEAFWGNYFNGAKKENPWVAHVAPEQLPKERRTTEIFGVEIASREHTVDLGRLFMARFGDIARVEASSRDVRVTLKSGTVFTLNRSAASDFDDGVQVWDRTRGVANLDSLRIRAIEFLPTSRGGAVPDRLHGTVHTRQGDFTGFVEWDRRDCLGSDELAAGELRLRFDTIRSIARRSSDSALVTLLDGREIVLSDDNTGIYVDDPRYGRVLVSWDAFERVDFSRGGSGPAYGDFPPGSPLTGSVTTRSRRRLAGRLVYDLDESEITETLDAPSRGVDYTIPFGLIASIVLRVQEDRARVILHSGEELQLERTGDLGKGNAGILVFVDGRPEYVPWPDVERVDLDRRVGAGFNRHATLVALAHLARIGRRYNVGYTVIVKTAVSLPDEIFRAAEATARRLRVSRSELYARAIAEFLKGQQENSITERLNDVYSQRAAKVDSRLHRAQLKSLSKDVW